VRPHVLDVSSDVWLGSMSFAQAVEFFHKRAQRAAEVRRIVGEGPPTVETVSPFEVYLLNENGDRVRRICGAKRRNLPKRFVCTRPPGGGTDHKGSGRCKLHEVSQWARLPSLVYNDQSYTRSFEGYAALAYEELSGRDIADVTPEIIDLTAQRLLLHDKINPTDSVRTLVPISRQVADIDKKIVDARKSHSDIQLSRLAAGNKQLLLERDARLIMLVQYFNPRLAAVIAQIASEQPFLGIDTNWDRKELLEYVKGLNFDNAGLLSMPEEET